MKILEYFKGQKEENNFNLLPDGIFTLEQDGKIIDVNNKILEIYEISRFDILGHYFSDFIENGFEDEHFKFVPREEYIALIEQMKTAGYTLIPCSEEFYYEDVGEENG